MGKTIINHPFGNGVHHLFMILGMVYCCFTHIIGYWDLFCFIVFPFLRPCESMIISKVLDSEDPSEMESLHSAEGIPESVEAGEVGGAHGVHGVHGD